MSAKAPSYSKQLLLAVILFGLGSFAYWLEYSKKPKEAAQEADAKKVFAFGTAHVKRFEIQGAKAEEKKDAKNKDEKATPYLLNVALECQSLGEKLCKPEDTSKWELAEPLKTHADDSTVNGLLKNFGNLTTSDTIDLSSDAPEKRAALLKDYGLSPEKLSDPNTRKVRFVLDDGRTLTAYFGEKAPTSDGSFAVAADLTKVFVVPNWQLSVFNQKTSYFRDKVVLSGNEREVVSFTIAVSKKNPGLKIEGTKDAKSGKWTLKAKGKEVAGDIDAIEGVLSGANHLQAKDFASERKDDAAGKKALAGAQPIYDLTMVTKDGTKRLHFFEKAGPKGAAVLYGTLDGTDPLFELDKGPVEKMDQKFEDLRLKKMIAVMDRYGIDGMAIESNGKNPWMATLKKTGANWTTSEGKPVAASKIDPILDRLSSSVVASFSGTAPSGEVLKIVFGNPEKPLGRDPAYELEFWKKGDRLYARDLRSPGKEPVELTKDFASHLPWDEGFLKN